MMVLVAERTTRCLAIEGAKDANALLMFGGDDSEKKVDGNSEEDATSHHKLPSDSETERFMQSRSKEDASQAKTLHTTLAKAGQELSQCTSCIYVLERIKMGFQFMLPSICVELFSLSSNALTYSRCHETLASLSVWGNNVRFWFHNGCYKSEPYGAMELIKPCPSHVICSQMQDLKGKAMCDPPKPDYVESSSGSSSGGKR